MKKIAVFASGTGSNFIALAEAAKNGELPAEIVYVICDKPGAPVIEKAKSYGIPTFVFLPKAYPNKAAFETEILSILREANVEWIFLAGYMRLIGDVLLEAYGNKIINTHPSLLPSFRGKDAIPQALEAGVKVTGVTIHYVDEGLDTGMIIAQAPVEVLKHDTTQELQQRLQKVEHKLFVQTAKQLLEGTVQ